VLPQTGGLAAFGVVALNGARLAIDEVNARGGIKGHPLSADVCDTGSDDARSVTCMKQMIADHVAAVVGPLTSPPVLATAPVAEDAKMPQFGLASATALTSPVRPFLFRVSSGNEEEFQYLADWLQQSKKYQQVALLTDDGAFGQDASRILGDSLPKRGIQILSTETYGASDTDMTAQLTRIRATDAQAIVNPSLVQAAAVIARNRQALGMTIPQITGSGVQTDAFIKLAGDAGEGLELVGFKVAAYPNLDSSDPLYATIDAFAKAYTARYPQHPDSISGLGWDSIHMLELALDKVDDPSDSVAVRDALEANVKGMKGVTAIWTYSQDNHTGNDTSGFVLSTLQKGQWVALKS
jgi:branched-chain amino acid transport system substrate-binding protein